MSLVTMELEELESQAEHDSDDFIVLDADDFAEVSGGNDTDQGAMFVGSRLKK